MIDFCIDARMAFSSGIGTYIREVVPFLKGFRVILLVDKVGRAWCKEFEQIPFDAPIYSIKEQLLYPLKIPACDLFWSPHYNIPLLPIRAKKRVATIHDACHLVFGSQTERIYAKWVMGKALQKSNEVITVSRFSKTEIERLVPKGSLHPIPIGVNLQRFVRVERSERVQKKYQLPKRYVLFVGNRKPHKNIDGLERAFTKAHVPGLELVVVGKGTRMGQVEDEDLPALYSMAEAFVFPSFYEGFGLPPLEAMGCGCPTAVSNAASMPEVCGDASLYFNPSSDEEMVEAILRAIENREPLIKKGFERVKLFDWRICAERHIALFEKVSHA